MEISKYIIIGGGMTGESAVEGIREVDEDGRIIMFSNEQNPPYNRPLLSKGLWKNKNLDDIWRKLKFENFELKLGTEIVEIQPDRKVVLDKQGNEFQFQKLLIATGGNPRRILKNDAIIYFRTVDDYLKITHLLGIEQKFAVLGSGFIGSELAAGLRMQGENVSIIDMGPGIVWRIFPQNIVDFLNNYYLSKGIKIHPDFHIANVSHPEDEFLISSDSGKQITADVLIAGFGIEPDVKLAKKANLDVADGIVVNEYLLTSSQDIYSAGDVANFKNPLLNSRIRVEHEDNANTMGKTAGRNMAGINEQYDYLPMFYSDMFDVGYEAVGILDSRFEVIQDWQEEFEKGVLYYLDGAKVRGVLLWNVWGKVEEAREIIGLEGPVKKGDLIQRIV